MALRNVLSKMTTKATRFLFYVYLELVLSEDGLREIKSVALWLTIVQETIDQSTSSVRLVWLFISLNVLT